MLTELQIKNIAIIDEATIEFRRGFNVLTGETGAGKSILIDSINMALGSRTSKELIRNGAEYGFVQAVFYVNDEISESISLLGADVEDNTVILARKVTADGRSTCRINGRITPLSIVREVGEMLLTIHGQNDNQALLVPAKHRGFVDKFTQNDKEIKIYTEKYNIYNETKAEYESLVSTNLDSEKRVELLKFQYNEISSAKLRPGEEEELENRQRFLANVEDIILDVNEAYSALYGSEEVRSAYDLLYDASNNLQDATAHDESLVGFAERISSVLADVEDVTHELKSYLDGVDYSAGELDMVQDRLALISELKRKYGCMTVEEIIAYAENCEKEIDNIDNYEKRIEELKQNMDEALSELKIASDALTKARIDGGKKLSKLIMNELGELDMNRVVFEVSVTESEYTALGADNVEFLISTNPGESLKPLSKIASGGEMSRIMLAIKSILAKDDIVDTLIFDEIDTGVSGRAAQKISEKICKISREKQVLCITHLAQIASMGDYQYLIEKKSDENTTTTDVRLLSRSERCLELSRIISGVEVTDTTLRTAEEMLNRADLLKKSFD